MRVAQTRFDDFPLAAVDHHRDRRGNVITGDQTQEARHRFDAIEQRVVKVDVDNRRAVFDLLASDLDRFVVLFVANQTREFAAAGDVGPFAHHRERNFRTHDHRQLSRQSRVDRSGRFLFRLQPLDALGHRTDVIRCRAATTAQDVDPTVVGILADFLRHCFRPEIELSHLVGQDPRWDDN